MDVVPANPKQWQVPPFSGEVKDGDIWGRGAIDDKGPGVIELMAMLAIKRAGILLNRDVMFVATGDEEEGGRNGAGWFVEHEKQVFADAGYLLNEGGGIAQTPGHQRFWAVSLAEKTPMWIRLTASGPAGHAAVPPDETAVTRLIGRAKQIDRVSLADPRDRHGARLLPCGGQARRRPERIQEHRDVVAQAGLPPQISRDPALQCDGQRHRHADRALRQPEDQRDSRPPPMRRSIAACCRARIPRNSSIRFVKVIGDDTIKVDVLLNFPAVSSPPRSILMTAIDAVAWQDGHNTVVPTMIAGFTDSHYFRAAGKNSSPTASCRSN